MAISEIPRFAFLVSGARVLDATNNMLRGIPPQIATFSSLQRLILTRNAISSLCPELLALRSLRVLALDVNRLAEIPEGIVGLTNLERLSLSHNSLAAIPDLSPLTKLTHLDISDNSLERLPPGLPQGIEVGRPLPQLAWPAHQMWIAAHGPRPKLQDVNASQNRITSLPGWIGSLPSLKALRLDQNDLRALPPEVFQGCASLHTLSLHDNPITAREVEDTPGYAQWEERRRAKFDKVVSSGVLLGARGLDEGVTRS